MDKKHRSAVQYVRHGVQVAAFLLIPGLFITIFSAVHDIVTAMVQGTFSLSQMFPQILLAGGVILITALLGRFFCGYLCSFGAFQELLYFLGGRHLRSRVPRQADRLLKNLKYIVLGLIVLLVWILQLPADSSWSPWGVFGILISGNFAAIPAALPTVGFFLLTVIAAASLFAEHFFCRYLCPLGAVFAASSKLKLLRIKRQRSTCTDCGICSRVCSMGVDVPREDSVASGECIQCMQCLPACPQSSLTVNPSGAVAGLAAAAAISGAALFGSTISLAADGTGEETPSAVQTESQVQHGPYLDGIYTGTGTGFRGPIEVQVTVDNGYMTDISVLSSGDDRQFLVQAQDGVIRDILAGQSADVSAVSGATYSSNGIMEAVADALGMDVSLQDAFSGRAPEGGISLPDEFREAELPEIRSLPAEPSATPEESAGSERASLALEDGVYEGEGAGFRGTTSVSVTVSGGEITDITVLSYADDAPYFRRAQDTVVAEILSTQSPDVQAVSGATYSSNGIMAAVADAIGAEFTAAAPSGAQRGHGTASAAGYGGTGRGKGRRAV